MMSLTGFYTISQNFSIVIERKQGINHGKPVPPAGYFCAAGEHVGNTNPYGLSGFFVNYSHLCIAAVLVTSDSCA